MSEDNKKQNEELTSADVKRCPPVPKNYPLTS